MTTQIPDQARGWFDAAEYVTIATINPDGQPQLSVVWVRLDGDDILVSTIEARQKYRNLCRDPRVTVLVNPKSNPFSYCEVRGVTTIVHEGGRELIDELNQKYNGTGRYTLDDGTDNVRVVLRITPERVHVR